MAQQFFLPGQHKLVCAAVGKILKDIQCSPDNSPDIKRSTYTLILCSGVKGWSNPVSEKER